eukprot:TRINITY_DN62245_c0_g1_i1.p1 TRINITY_DN62245_c0_g1~~TRINITY_DN62245_c0_g1_i1.p1  ORF type:complete len:286 (+),score=35.23 TRINITY_DN62245_c0_g1_i1:58-858(+)
MAPSSADALLSGWLQLPEVQAPYGIELPLDIGFDALWPLAAMLSYVVMVKTLQSGLVQFPGSHTGLQQAYNVAIIAVSAAILVPTLYFRVTSATSLRVAYCPSPDRVLPEGLRLCLWAYHVSKYTEYLDTAFLVLKGKSVGSLHFWHHLVVTFTSWTWYRSNVDWVADGVIFNTFVHCIMYYYYYLAGAKRPPWWKKYVTLLQITQFVTSFIATSFWAYFHATVGCSSLRVILLSVAFNGWLLVMFIRFYGASYRSKKGDAEPKGD